MPSFNPGAFSDELNAVLSLKKYTGELLNGLGPSLRDRVLLLSQREETQRASDVQSHDILVIVNVASDQVYAREVSQGVKGAIVLHLHVRSRPEVSELDAGLVLRVLTSGTLRGLSVGPFYNTVDPEDFGTWEEIGFMPVTQQLKSQGHLTDAGLFQTTITTYISHPER